MPYLSRDLAFVRPADFMFGHPIGPMTDIKMPPIAVFLPPGNQYLIVCCSVFERKIDLLTDIVNPSFLHPFYTIGIEFAVSTQAPCLGSFSIIFLVIPDSTRTDAIFDIRFYFFNGGTKFMHK